MCTLCRVFTGERSLHFKQQESWRCTFQSSWIPNWARWCPLTHASCSDFAQMLSSEEDIFPKTAWTPLFLNSCVVLLTSFSRVLQFCKSKAMWNWRHSCMVGQRLLCSGHVQQGLWSWESQWGQTSPAYQWQEDSGEHTSHSSMFGWAYEESIVAGLFLLQQALRLHQEIPDFREWGWHSESNGTWVPYLTTLEDSSKAFSILSHCGCEKCCTGNCKCSRAGVHCTGLCKCEGGCIKNED